MAIRISGRSIFQTGKVNIITQEAVSLEFVDSTQNIGGSKVTSFTATKPAGVSPGDLIVCPLFFNNNNNAGPGNLTSSDGFVRHPSDPAIHSSGTFDWQFTTSIWWKEVQVGDPSSYTWTWDTAMWPAFCALGFSGVEITDPIDNIVDDYSERAGTASTYTFAEHDIDSDGSMLVIGFLFRDDFGDRSITSKPTGYTTAENGRNAAPPQTRRYEFETGYKSVDAGLTGNQSFTLNDNLAGSGIMISLKPAS